MIFNVGLSGISTVTGRDFLSWVKSEIMSWVQLFFFFFCNLALRKTVFEFVY